MPKILSFNINYLHKQIEINFFLMFLLVYSGCSKWDSTGGIWMFKRVFFGIFLLFLFSCSPKYSIQTVYIPPSSEKGKSCVKECEEKFDRCKKDCLKFYQVCIKEAFQLAEKTYTRALKDFEKLHKLYLEKYRLYLKEKSMWEERYLKIKSDYQYYRQKCSLDKNWCDEMEFYKNLLKDIEAQMPEKPLKPKEPSFKDILKTQQDMCKKSCNCREAYNICFQNCGGRIKIKKVCIENCQ